MFPYTRIHNFISVLSVGAILMHRVLHGQPDQDTHIVHRLYQPASYFPPFPAPAFYNSISQSQSMSAALEENTVMQYTTRFGTAHRLLESARGRV